MLRFTLVPSDIQTHTKRDVWHKRPIASTGTPTHEVRQYVCPGSPRCLFTGRNFLHNNGVMSTYPEIPTVETFRETQDLNSGGGDN